MVDSPDAVASQLVIAGVIGPDERVRFDGVVSTFTKALNSALAEAVIGLLAATFVAFAIRALTTDGVRV